MATSFFVNSGAVIVNALAGKSLNGMYLFFTNTSGASISELETAINSGATINNVAAACISGGSIGVTRLTNIVTTPGSSGGMMFVANTGNQAPVSGGTIISAGQFARAISLANISVTVDNADTGFDYTVLDSPVVVPAGGTITLIDEVTL